MAKEVIISTPQNDPNGTPLDAAFTMCNNNFTEIYDTNIMSGGVNAADVKLQVTGSGGASLTISDPGSGYTVGLEYDAIDSQKLGTGMKATVATATGGGPVITNVGRGYVDGTTVELENRAGTSASYAYSASGSGSTTEYTMTITNGIITKFENSPK
jgi:hypothetical protein|tara:strand:+ start:378 stop:848 length:471 start_codon:yes stop_codon:yes gene_type:complete